MKKLSAVVLCVLGEVVVTVQFGILVPGLLR